MKYRVIVTETTESAYLVDGPDEMTAMRTALEDHLAMRDKRVWFHIADRIVEVDGGGKLEGDIYQ